MCKELARIQKPPLVEVEETPIVSAEPLTVVYEFWRVTQSQYHYREIGKVNLGPLDEES